MESVTGKGEGGQGQNQRKGRRGTLDSVKEKGGGTKGHAVPEEKGAARKVAEERERYDARTVPEEGRGIQRQY